MALADSAAALTAATSDMAATLQILLDTFALRKSIQGPINTPAGMTYVIQPERVDLVIGLVKTKLAALKASAVTAQADIDAIPVVTP